MQGPLVVTLQRPVCKAPLITLDVNRFEQMHRLPQKRADEPGVAVGPGRRQTKHRKEAPIARHRKSTPTASAILVTEDGIPALSILAQSMRAEVPDVLVIVGR